MRHVKSCLLIGLAIWFVGRAAFADDTYNLDIPAQPLAKALQAFAEQSGIQVVYYAQITDGHTGGRVLGALSLTGALSQLLAGTNLTFETVNADTVAIREVLPENLSGRGGLSKRTSRGGGNETGGMRLAEGESSQRAEAADDRGISQGNVSDEAEDSSAGQIQEIIVTAQKRSEKLMDVPSAISAVSGDRLESLQVSSLADLANYVPGMSIIGGGSPGARTIVLRGLNTNYNNNTVRATVATYIDDLPVTGSLRGAQYGIDLQPYDLERIEVLKGPQGTLYGASAMGGLVKYILRKPDLTQFQLRVGSELSYVDGSGGADWGVRASLNLPLVSDKLGLLVTGYEKRGAGYIDNIGIGVDNANDWTQRGGRASLLWQPSDNFSVRATMLAQDDEADNVSEVTVDATTGKPFYGAQRTSTLFPEPYEQKIRNYSLGVDWNLGFANLTSSSGWSEMDWALDLDLTVPYGLFCQPGLLGPGWSGCPDYPFSDALALFEFGGPASKFVQEVRLTSSENQRIQWMLGGYYTREKTGQGEIHESFPTFTPSYVPLSEANNLLFDTVDYIYKETAVFANVTYPFTERFDVSVGARHSTYKSNGCAFNGGLFFTGFGIPPNDNCSTLPSQTVPIQWMTNIRFHLNTDAMVYARAATGYRPGGGCEFYDDGTPCGIPNLGISGIVDPDQTKNYEMGFKGIFLDRLQLDVSAFYIDWTDIQIPQITAGGLGYAGNGSKASSRGVELTMAYQLFQDLQLNTTLAYTDAHLDEDAPGAGGNAGDQLPNAPKWTGSLTADYQQPLSDRMTMLLGGGYRYRDAIVNVFSNATFQNYPAPMGPQNIVDLYAGLVVKDLTLRLYGANVFDDRSYTGLQFMNDPTKPKFVPIRPRTIGLSLDYQF